MYTYREKDRDRHIYIYIYINIYTYIYIMIYYFLYVLCIIYFFKRGRGSGGAAEFLKRCTHLMFALNVFNKSQNVLYEVITCCKLIVLSAGELFNTKYFSKGTTVLRSPGGIK